MASDGEALIGLWLEGQKYFAQTLGPEVQEADLPIFRQTAAWLDAYFMPQGGQQLVAPALPELPRLAPRGSEFRQRVWKLLLEIPYGEVTTYGALAKRLAVENGRKTMSAQAVGGAVGHNPISILIPCHRVVNRQGRTAPAFAFGGPDIQRAMLENEGVLFTEEGLVDMKACLWQPKES
jgi:methylated-DNA-[protein]-cysteine S-methyltransferase